MWSENSPLERKRKKRKEVKKVKRLGNSRRTRNGHDGGTMMVETLEPPLRGGIIGRGSLNVHERFRFEISQRSGPVITEIVPSANIIS